ncbi:hypothetical protein SDC9_166544 [bioreactor metagenome]|uniref:Uncharacterized protein n=1 Tax=bioreactor metagenome TaxID=1076179 RepID=A0A645FXB8_9ZZZZ
MIGVLSISGFFISRRFHGASFYQVIGICFLITHLAGLLLLAIFVAVIQRNYYIVYSPERATAMAEIINYLFFTIIALSTAGMIAIKIMAAKKHGREVDNQK